MPLRWAGQRGTALDVARSVRDAAAAETMSASDRAREAVAAPALASAAARRLRPILMTTLCTVFGLLPLAFAWGAGSELQRPLAIAVVGGLLVSTLATLLALPLLGAGFLGRPPQTVEKA